MMQTNLLTVYAHIMYEHDKIPCSYCGEMIAKKRMSRHVGQKHTDNADRKFQCTVCGKGFMENKGLQDHMNIHTGDKPYMCNYCGARFANNGTCRMHERMVHLGHKRNEIANFKRMNFAFKDEKD